MITSLPEQNIPSLLKSSQQWIVWKLEGKTDTFKGTKIPYSSKNPYKKASTTNPVTWSSLGDALAIAKLHDMSGIGYVFTEEQGIVAIDVDGCIVNGVPTDIGKDILNLFLGKTYVEVSQSGTGYHILTKGTLKKTSFKAIEVYTSGRYFAITGNSIGDCNAINPTQEELDVLCDRYARDITPQPIVWNNPTPSQKSTNFIDQLNLRVQDIGYPGNAKQSGVNEIRGSHPFHGSTSGMNYAINSSKNVWICRRDGHNSGGGPLELFAVREGIIKCEDARAGCLDGKWKEVIKALKRCGYDVPDKEGYGVPDFKETPTIKEPQKNSPPTKKDVVKKKIYAGQSTGEFEKVQQALGAIVQVYNKPFPRVFVRGGKLCRVIYDENDVPRIDRLEESSLSVILTQCIDWYINQEITVEVKTGDEKKKEKKQIEVITVTPPLVVTRLYAMGQWEGIPALTGIVEAPYIWEDGNIVSTPGYNPQSKLYLTQLPSFKGVNISEHPTNEEVRAAKELLFELFSEFNFEDDASRENHIACLVTSTIRPIIKGVVPLMVYDKPVMGTGASLLAELITGITTGRPASMVQAPDKNASGEMNKLIIGLLREGRTLNIFDNVEGDIYSSALAQLLTSTIYSGRILGKNATETYPNLSVWIANGNNIQITHDLPRRCVWIRLATDVARPYERTNWKIKNIRKHVFDNQGDYLSAILTIVRGWYLAGKPLPSKKLQIMGGFEEWSEMVGGIMKFMGCKNFLKNTSENLDVAEEATEDVEVFLEAIFYAFPQSVKTKSDDGKQYSRSFTIKEITPVEDPVNYVKGNSSVLVDHMPGYLQEIQREHPKKLPHSVGNLFRKLIGRVFPQGYKLDRVKKGGSDKIATYIISFKEPIKTPKTKEENDDDE